MFYSCSVVGSAGTLILGSLAVAVGSALVSSAGATTSVLIPGLGGAMADSTCPYVVLPKYHIIFS
jgi:hypothetical protein